MKNSEKKKDPITKKIGGGGEVEAKETDFLFASQGKQ